MRPKKPKTTINMKHKLVQLAFKIDWDWIDGEIAPLYSDKGPARDRDPVRAQYVKPYLKGHKNDFRDAEAIAEAVQRPTMRFVGWLGGKPKLAKE
jgi:hypothetical protein